MKRRHLLVILFAAIAATALPARVARASTQDFTIPIFEADYYLSRDTQHISHLQVSEHIVAEFPAIDQNHGILRAIPKSYQGHSVNLHIQSLTDAARRPWHYTTSTQNGNLVLKIGDADRYVHGRQTYDITYTMTNVTAKTAGFDGHFWDVNGDQWSQPFGRVAARVHLTPELAAALQPARLRCFTGPTGATASDCTIASRQTNDGTITDVTTTRPLNASETLTYELDFAPDTFVPYTIPRDQLIQLVARIVFLGLLPPLLALIFVINRWRRFGRDPAGRGVIIAQYLPPKTLSVIASSVLLRESFQAKTISAQILDLAVRHYLKIYEVKTKQLFKPKTTYQIELIRSPDGLRDEEKATVDLLFSHKTTIGARISLDDLKNKLYQGAQTIGSDVTKQLVRSGHFRSEPRKAMLPYLIGGFILLGLSFFGFPYSLGVAAAGLIVLIAAQVMPARTQLGVDQRDYLLGLKLYMQMAEADRIKALQSPHGSLTEKIDVTDTTQLVKLYEKLLPYAMLFGIEKDWAKQFANLYTQDPDWYTGSSSSFNAAYFAGSLSSFSAASTASFTAPSSSGSGGSAGGGGGGGGGGGW